VRSHTDPRDARSRGAVLSAVSIAAVLIAATATTRAATAVQQESAPAGAGSPGRVEIARALEIVKADPNLTPERTTSTLHWKNARDLAKPEPFSMPGWLKWIAGLFRWLDQSARLLVWGAAIVLAGYLVVFIVRVVRTRGASLRWDDPFVAPTHVRDLDIRPESLPPDIGAAARALWDRGEHRAALALLYRGMLSRLAHVHRMPIRDSSTEGDCLALAARHLTPRRHEYASRLVRVWQRAVYGREEVQGAAVYVLCEDFAPVLDRGPDPGLDRGLDRGAPLDSMTSGGAA